MSSVRMAESIIEVVELVHELQSRPPNEEERQRLASWMGWGPVTPAFEKRVAKEWAEVAGRLTMSLGPEGIKLARAATPHSYFTDRFIAASLWDIAVQLGFDGGRVLEPGCGSGAILSAAPKDLPLQMVGIEREPFSASVARLRLPQATIITSALEDLAMVRDSFDLVIGNVPFADVAMYDRDLRYPLSLHNYFLWRSLQALRPGGLAVLLTSRYTLDAERAYAREILAELGQLVGTIRLPSGAHRAAGTEVITDILVFQRSNPQVPPLPIKWMELSDTLVEGVKINAYFEAHPYSLLGTASLSRGMYHNNELVIKSPPDLPAALTQAVESLTREIGQCYVPPKDYTRIPETLVHRRTDGRKEGSYHLIDDQLVQIVEGQAKPVVQCRDELKMLVQLRNATVALFEAERDLDRDDASLEPLRRNLNERYDAYVDAYGPLHRARLCYGEMDEETGEQTITRRRPPALSAFRRDPQYTLILGLEEYDEETETGKKVEIFFQRIHRRPVRKTSADSPAEAIALCLDECGKVDLAVLARLLGIAIEAVPEAMGDLIYEDPIDGTWEQASIYLSGNVRLKLSQAKSASEVHPRSLRNVAALEKIQPEDILPDEIRALLGAPWIDASDIARFVADLLKMKVEVSYQPLTAAWSVQEKEQSSQPNPANIGEWGTRRAPALALIECGLNKKVPIVYDTLSDGSTVRNADETLDAQEKLRLISERFSEWVWEDARRATRLAAEYNRLFNAEVVATYDGSHLTFPGMNAYWEKRLYPWQKDFVYRMTMCRAALCAHPVGAGKTTQEIAGAMTLRRLGLITKAAIVVPNHLLEQISGEAQRLYPSARILMISRDDLGRERRGIFAARVASGDYDFVVMTHAAFGGLGVHPETERAYLEQRLAVYRQALIDAEKEEESAHQRRTVKSLEKAMERMRQRMKELLKKQPEGVTFEQLGISYLIIDEAHLYKNLGLPTKIQGFQVQASRRAADLEMKLRYLEKHTDGKPFAAFFTATPISNNMVEAYVVGWYLAQQRLFDMGLPTVEAFVSTFVDLQSRVEVSPDGATFRLHTRPAHFVNMPEFMSLFASFADIRGPEILDAKRPKRVDLTISIEPSSETQAFVDGLVKRAEAIHRGTHPSHQGREDNMLWVTTDGRKAALSLTLVGKPASHEPKLETVAAKMLAVYWRCQQEMAHLSGTHKSLQIGFCDLGTPSAEKGDQAYGILKKMLIAGGLPAKSICYVHEAKNDAAKAELFRQCRSGEVAILLGSTLLLGTGTNIQTRCAAIHHIDAPWRPDEVEQREGRGHRPGNLYSVVQVYRYVQRRTFDAYSWQTLMNKAIFFDQMRRGKIVSREMEAHSETALSYGQVRAAATGDPLVLEHAEVEIMVARLQKLLANHRRARSRDGQDGERYRYQEERSQLQAKILHAIHQTASASLQPGFATERGERIAEADRIGGYISQRVLTRLLGVGSGWEPVGSWSGVPIALRLRGDADAFWVTLLVGDLKQEWNPEINVPQSLIGSKQQGQIAEELQSFFEDLPTRIGRAAAEAIQYEKRAEAYEAQSRLPFPQEEELRRRLSRKLALDAYIAKVAVGKVDEDLREQLLREATQIVNQLLDAKEVPSPSEEAVKSREGAPTIQTSPSETSSSEVKHDDAPPSSEVKAAESEDTAQPLISPTLVAKLADELNRDPWANPIVAKAEADVWASYRERYGVPKRRKKRR